MQAPMPAPSQSPRSQLTLAAGAGCNLISAIVAVTSAPYPHHSPPLELLISCLPREPSPPYESRHHMRLRLTQRSRAVFNLPTGVGRLGVCLQMSMYVDACARRGVGVLGEDGSGGDTIRSPSYLGWWQARGWRRAGQQCSSDITRIRQTRHMWC